MRTGRPKQALILTDEERDRLQSLAHRARSQPLLARRARVVLACAEGLDNKTVARKMRVSLGMVGKWRARFLQARLEGLYDEPRPGTPRKVSDAEVERVVIQTLESTPRGETHWSTRSMAKATGLSRMTISRIWRAFGLQPHRTDTFKLSPDPLLIEKVRDIVGLYMNPPIMPWSCAWTRRRKFKPLTAPNRCCLYARGNWSAAPMTTNAMGRLRCSLPWN
jgi:transposase